MVVSVNIFVIPIENKYFIIHKENIAINFWCDLKVHIFNKEIDVCIVFIAIYNAIVVSCSMHHKKEINFKRKDLV